MLDWGQTEATTVEDRSQVNLRLDDRTRRMLVWLQRKLNLNATAVLKLAIARLAETEGWKDD